VLPNGYLRCTVDRVVEMMPQPGRPWLPPVPVTGECGTVFRSCRWLARRALLLGESAMQEIPLAQDEAL
jgi:hypothetical protein